MATVVPLWFLPLLSFSSLVAYGFWNAKLRRDCDALLLAGRALFEVARYRQAVDTFEEGFRIASRILLGRGDRAVLCALGSAEALRNAGQKAGAYDAVMTAFLLSRRRADSPYALRLYSLLADLSEEAHLHRAIGMRQVVVELLTRAQPGSRALAEQLGRLGTSLASAGLTDHAVNSLERAAEIMRRRALHHPEDQPAYAHLLVPLGSALGQLGRFPKAEETLETALQILRAHHQSTAALRELGALYCLQEHYDQAFALFEEAYRVQVRRAGASDAQVGLILATYADGLRKAGRLAEAEETAARAVRLLKVHQHPALVGGLATLGAVLLAERNFSGAVDVFEQADAASCLYQTSPLETAERLESHAQALAALHRALDAEQLRAGASSIRAALAAAPPAGA